MFDARVTRVLISLVASMTAGALVLMSLESGTSHPGSNRGAVMRSRARDCISLPKPDRPRHWKRIVIHSSTDETLVPSLCHFVVSRAPNRIRATVHWKEQKQTAHLHGDGCRYDDTIGVCIMGDFSGDAPDKALFDSLVVLVRELQASFTIGADSVYLRKELDPASRIPGDRFPTTLFNARLLRFDD